MATFTLTLGETLTLVDTASLEIPYVRVTNSVRRSASTLLRMFRRPHRYVSVSLPPKYTNIEPGDTIWCAHELLPEIEEGPEIWKLVPLYVVEVDDPIVPASIQLRCLDLREFYCSAWSPLRTDLGMTNDLNGIAYVDRGGGWSTIRDQLAYGERPGGDTVLQEVLANQPVVCVNGLQVEGGSDTNHLLNSTFSEGSGASFTNWTYVSTGAAFAAEWSLYTLIDGTGFRRAIQLTTANAGENSYVQQTVTGMGTKRLFVKVYYKNGGAVDDPVLRIQRSSDSKWWRDSDQTWQVAATDNVISPKSGVIDSLLYTTRQIDLTGVPTTSITVQVGHIPSAAAVYQITQLQGVELIESPYANTDEFVKYRSPLPTKAAAVTRVKNETYLNNDSAVRVFSTTRGFVKLTFKPNWNHADIASSSVKYIWAVDHILMYCAYVNFDPTTAHWRFVNGFGQTAVLETTSVAVRGLEYTIACRWTSSAQDEFALGGQAFDIWVGGVRGTTLPFVVEDVLSATSRFYLGRSSNGDTTGNYYADGWISHLTMGDHCPTEAELMRI